MVSKDIVSKLKSSCIGIVIRQKGNAVPLVVGGTGFIIDPEGYFITATHVIEALKKTITELNKNSSKDIKLGVTHTEIIKGEAQIVTLDIAYTAKMDIKNFDIPYFGPKEYDLAVGKIKGKISELPFLKIKSPCKLDILDEIAMCGYPGGDKTLNVNNDEYGMKLSPLLQTGKISGIMPIDDTNQPTGIQTSIIGTGGSSGSPIIDVNDGEVIGVAQNIIPTPVQIPSTSYDGERFGYAQIGMVFGVSNYFLQPTAKKTLKILKQEIDEDNLESGKKLEQISREINLEFDTNSVN